MGPENRVSSKYRVSSESSVFTSHFPKMDEQEEYLLEKRSEKDSEVSMNRQELRYRPRSSYLIALLMLSNLVVLLAILLTLVLHDNKSKKIDRNQSSNPSWFPPERFHKKIFDYEPIYATENAEEAQKAWTNLIPGMLERDPSKRTFLMIYQWERDLSLLGMTPNYQTCHN